MNLNVQLSLRTLFTVYRDADLIVLTAGKNILYGFYPNNLQSLTQSLMLWVFCYVLGCFVLFVFCLFGFWVFSSKIPISCTHTLQQPSLHSPQIRMQSRESSNTGSSSVWAIPTPVYLAKYLSSPSFFSCSEAGRLLD